MKLRKTLSWSIRALWLLLLAAAATALRAAPEPVDPLVGNWFYFRDQPATFDADGTAVRDGNKRGTWEYLHNPEVQRHYRVIWEHGKSIDLLVLAEDGRHAHVNNQTARHAQYEVRRMLPDKPAATPGAAPAKAAAGTPSAPEPILGDWLWAYNRPVTFQADGTAVSPKDPQGVWERLPDSEAGPRYRVTWGGGKYVDTFSCTPGAPLGLVVNQKGKQYNVRRSPPAEPSAAGPSPLPSASP